MDLQHISEIERAAHSGRGELLRLGIGLLFIVGVMFYAAMRGSGEGGLMLVMAAMVGGYMAMNIGANDVANNVGPAVGSKALSLAGALVIAAVFEAAGALIAGGEVVGTIRNGIINPDLITDSDTFVWIMLAALLAGALWLNFATAVGAPVSTTHSIVGAVLGAGMAAAGVAAAAAEPDAAAELDELGLDALSFEMPASEAQISSDDTPPAIELTLDDLQADLERELAPGSNAADLARDGDAAAPQEIDFELDLDALMLDDNPQSVPAAAGEALLTEQAEPELPEMAEPLSLDIELPVLAEESAVQETLAGDGLDDLQAVDAELDAAFDAFERLRSTCADLRRQSEDAPFVLACPGSLLARWFIPRLDRLNRELPELRLQLSASEGELDPRRPGVDATLCFANPPWPADLQVYELAAERIGPVFSPRHARAAELAQAPASALLGEALLHTVSRPQAWPQWAASQGLGAAPLQLGQGFEHLYYLLEAAMAGLGVAIAPQQLVADDLAAGRLLAPWGFTATGGRLALWVPGRRSDRRAEQLAAWLARELRD